MFSKNIMTFPHQFFDANQEVVPYDGSPVALRVSAYAVIIQQDKVLLAKSKHDRFYDVIGGRVEIGETIEDALHREALEEGGATIEVGTILFSALDWFYHRKGTFYQSLQLYYTATVVGDLAQPTDPEMEWVGFVPLSEVGKQYKLGVSPPAERKLLEFFLEMQNRL